MDINKLRCSLTSVKRPVPHVMAWNETFSKKEDLSFKKYSAEILQQFSYPVVSRLVSGKGIFRRLIWMVALSCCLVFFIKSSKKFLANYHRHPVVVNLEVENEGQLRFPAVTLCNQNRMRKAELNGPICQSRMDLCQQLQDIELSVLQQENRNQNYTIYPECSRHRYNERSNHTEKILAFIRAYSRFSAHQRRKMSHRLEEMLVECTYAGERCISRDFTLSESFEYGTCYTFNGKWSPPKRRSKKSLDSSEETDNKFQSNSERKKISNEHTEKILEAQEDEEYFQFRETRNDNKFPIPEVRKLDNYQFSQVIKESTPFSGFNTRKTRNVKHLSTSNLKHQRKVHSSEKSRKRAENNRHAETPEKPRVYDLISRSSSPKNGLQLIINLQPDEYLAITPKLGLHVLIHGKHDYPYPEDAGIDISAGFDTTFGLEEHAFERLKAPYKDKCIDYRKEKESGRDQQSCIRECFLDIALDKCRCVEPAQGFLTDEQLCDQIEEEDVCCMQETWKFFNLSKCDCPLSCRDVKYDITLFSTMWPSESEFKLRSAKQESYQTFRKGHLRMNVFFKSLDRIIYSQQAVYESEEIFSHLGGQMGLWLGMSLMTIFEFVEAVILILQSLFAKNLSTKRCS